MLRRLSAALAAVFAAAVIAWAANIIPTPLPVILQNGTLADASQVMTDFNAIVNNVNASGQGLFQSNSTTANFQFTPVTLTGPVTPVGPYNITSINYDAGSFQYTVAFTTATANSNYNIIVTPCANGSSLAAAHVISRTTSNFVFDFAVPVPGNVSPIQCGVALGIHGMVLGGF